ncbi:hypothetical protein PYCC9005_002181 [Savitreella phatthalungensis]
MVIPTKKPLTTAVSPIRKLWEHISSPPKSAHKLSPNKVPHGEQRLALESTILSSNTIVTTLECSVDVELRATCHVLAEKRKDSIWCNPVAINIILDAESPGRVMLDHCFDAVSNLCNELDLADTLSIYGSFSNMYKHRLMRRTYLTDPKTVLKRLRSVLPYNTTDASIDTHERSRNLLNIVESCVKPKQHRNGAEWTQTILLFITDGFAITRDVMNRVSDIGTTHHTDCIALGPLAHLEILQKLAHASERGCLLHSIDLMGTYVRYSRPGMRPLPARDVRLEIYLAAGVDILRPTQFAEKTLPRPLVVKVPRLGAFEELSRFYRLLLPSGPSGSPANNPPNTTPAWSTSRLHDMVMSEPARVLAYEISYSHPFLQEGARIVLPAFDLKLKRISGFVFESDVDLILRHLMHFARTTACEVQRCLPSLKPRQELLDAMLEAEHELSQALKSGSSLCADALTVFKYLQLHMSQIEKVLGGPLTASASLLSRMSSIIAATASSRSSAQTAVNPPAPSKKHHGNPYLSRSEHIGMVGATDPDRTVRPESRTFKLHHGSTDLSKRHSSESTDQRYLAYRRRQKQPRTYQPFLDDPFVDPAQTLWSALEAERGHGNPETDLRSWRTDDDEKSLRKDRDSRVSPTDTRGTSLQRRLNDKLNRASSQSSLLRATRLASVKETAPREFRRHSGTPLASDNGAYLRRWLEDGASEVSAEFSKPRPPQIRDCEERSIVCRADGQKLSPVRFPGQPHIITPLARLVARAARSSHPPTWLDRAETPPLNIVRKLTPTSIKVAQPDVDEAAIVEQLSISTLPHTYDDHENAQLYSDFDYDADDGQTTSPFSPADLIGKISVSVSAYSTVPSAG